MHLEPQVPCGNASSLVLTTSCCIGCEKRATRTSRGGALGASRGHSDRKARKGTAVCTTGTGARRESCLLTHVTTAKDAMFKHNVPSVELSPLCTPTRTLRRHLPSLPFRGTPIIHNPCVQCNETGLTFTIHSQFHKYKIGAPALLCCSFHSLLRPFEV